MSFFDPVGDLAISSPVIALRGVFFPLWIFYALGAVILVTIIREIVMAVNGGPVSGLGAPFYTALGIILGLGGYLLRTGGF